jgi:hypothetical protein
MDWRFNSSSRATCISELGFQKDVPSEGSSIKSTLNQEEWSSGSIIANEVYPSAIIAN